MTEWYSAAPLLQSRKGRIHSSGYTFPFVCSFVRPSRSSSLSIARKHSFLLPSPSFLRGGLSVSLPLPLSLSLPPSLDRPLATPAIAIEESAARARENPSTLCNSATIFEILLAIHSCTPPRKKFSIFRSESQIFIEESSLEQSFFKKT